MELARTFESLDFGYALVLHERMKREDGDPYIRELRKINGRNLFLSLDPLPIEEVDRLYASATIGLAFYKALDSNFSLMSMASGKLGYYLKHGKPVLVNDLPSLSTFVESREIGVVVRDPCDPAQVRRAVESILANYARFSANARKCFLEELDFDRNVLPVTTFLGQVAESSRQ
jgi:glycosyltransferase involved in cell wall biosynthesis